MNRKLNISYLNNEIWDHVSREERFFCFELYNSIKGEPTPFLDLISRNPATNYDIGVEVCFYRDIMYEFGMSIKGTSLPYKRTFDLALFSPDEIIIIEAKSNQGFESEQLEYFRKDLNVHIPKLFNIIKQSPIPKVSIIALHSSKYSPKPQTMRVFDSQITWKNIAKIYKGNNRKRLIFESADNCYG